MSERSTAPATSTRPRHSTPGRSRPSTGDGAGDDDRSAPRRGSTVERDASFASRRRAALDVRVLARPAAFAPCTSPAATRTSRWHRTSFEVRGTAATGALTPRPDRLDGRGPAPVAAGRLRRDHHPQHAVTNDLINCPGHALDRRRLRHHDRLRRPHDRRRRARRRRPQQRLRRVTITERPRSTSSTTACCSTRAVVATSSRASTLEANQEAGSPSPTQTRAVAGNTSATTCSSQRDPASLLHRHPERAHPRQRVRSPAERRACGSRARGALVEDNDIVDSGGAGVVTDGGTATSSAGTTSSTSRAAASLIGEELRPDEHASWSSATRSSRAPAASLVSESDSTDRDQYNVVRGRTAPGVVLELAPDTHRPRQRPARQPGRHRRSRSRPTTSSSPTTPASSSARASRSGRSRSTTSSATTPRARTAARASRSRTPRPTGART